MKKGFTLIELLIVMVVVGVLVTISLPKYRASMERGRAMEAITNLRAASDIVNARYVINGNSYTATGVATSASNGTFVSGDFTKEQYFTAPRLTLTSGTAGSATVTTSRDDSSYTLKAYNSGGDLQYIECTGDAELCQNIGMELSGGKYLMRFTE